MKPHQVVILAGIFVFGTLSGYALIRMFELRLAPAWSLAFGVAVVAGWVLDVEIRTNLEDRRSARRAKQL